MDCFYELVSGSHASVYVLFEEFHIFYVKVGIHAQVRTGNLDITISATIITEMRGADFIVFRIN